MACGIGRTYRNVRVSQIHGRQLVEAFGGTDLTASLDISGQMVSLDEYWASELCFKMVG